MHTCNAYMHHACIHSYTHSLDTNLSIVYIQCTHVMLTYLHLHTHTFTHTHTYMQCPNAAFPLESNKRMYILTSWPKILDVYPLPIANIDYTDNHGRFGSILPK